MEDTLNEVPKTIDAQRKAVISKLIDDRQTLMDGYREMTEMICMGTSVERLKEVMLKTLSKI